MPIDKIITKLSSICEPLANKTITLIFTQVDPDAVGASLLLAFILEKKFKIKTEIFYYGGIGHVQNRYLFERCPLTNRLQPVSARDAKETDIVALVDSNSMADERSGVIIGRNLLTFDHHKYVLSNGSKENPDSLICIDQDAGSTCTMLVELVEALELEFDGEEAEELATVVALGIFTDTKRIQDAADRDIAAYEFTSRQGSRRLLIELISYPRPESFYRRLASAIGRMQRKGPRLVTGIGAVSDNPDDVSTVAEELLLMEGLTLVVVWVLVEDRVRLSIRTDNPSFSVADFIQKKFDSGGARVVNGRGVGGAQMEIFLGPWLIPETKDDIYRVINTYLTSVVFAEDN